MSTRPDDVSQTRDPPPPGSSEPDKASNLLEKVRAYSRVVEASGPPSRLPIHLVPEAGRRALFRSLGAIIPADRALSEGVP